MNLKTLAPFDILLNLIKNRCDVIYTIFFSKIQKNLLFVLNEIKLFDKNGYEKCDMPYFEVMWYYTYGSINKMMLRLCDFSSVQSIRWIVQTAFYKKHFVANIVISVFFFKENQFLEKSFFQLFAKARKQKKR